MDDTYPTLAAGLGWAPCAPPVEDVKGNYFYCYRKHDARGDDDDDGEEGQRAADDALRAEAAPGLGDDYDPDELD